MYKSPNVTSRREFLKSSALGAGGFVVAGSGLLVPEGSALAAGPREYSFGPPVEEGAPRKGGTLRVGFVTAGNAETVDPRKAVQMGDLVRASALYDPLCFVAPKGGGVIPGLATKWETNAKGDLWTFTLREGVQWHNGKTLTAQDVVYTVQKGWTAPDNPLSAVLAKVVDTANVKADGPRTVVIPLKLPMAEFPTITTFQNLYVVQDGFTDWDKPVGTGPFMFESFTPGETSTFKSNPNYWDGGPPIEKLVIDTSFAQDQTRFNAFQAKNLDIIPILPPAFARLVAGNADFYLGNQPGPGWTGPTFRVDTDPFKQIAVRQALKFSLDRKVILNGLFGGYGVVGNDCVGNTDQYFASDLVSPYDPDRAKSILKKAGLSDLKLEIATAAETNETNAIATLFSQQARKAGIDMSVKQIDPAIYTTPSSGYQTRPFSMEWWFTGCNSLSLFYLTYLVTDAAFGVTMWGGAENDALVYGAMAETDSAKATEKWRKVQQLQHDEGGVLNAVNYNWLDGYQKNVRGVKTTSAGCCDNFNYSKAWLTN